jgi:hypothetical protein
MLEDAWRAVLPAQPAVSARLIASSEDRPHDEHCHAVFPLIPFSLKLEAGGVPVPVR